MKVIHIPEKEVEDFVPKDFGGIRNNKTVCIVRYGAFGDIIQASSLFPIFKEEGYEVCVNVTPVGAGLLTDCKVPRERPNTSDQRRLSLRSLSSA